MAVRVERLTEDRDWESVELRDDDTPEGHGPGRKSLIYASPDGKVVVYFWTRSGDHGVLNASTKAGDKGQKFDVVLSGETEITDASDGAKHTVRGGEVLSYSMTDKGEWHQDGPLSKVGVAIYE